MTVKHYQLPQYLADHREEILKAFQNEKGSKYTPGNWLEEFKSDDVISEDLHYIVNKHPQGISRHDLTNLAVETKSGDFQDIRRFFLATMIWGWMEDKPKRGPRNIKRSVQNPNFQKILETSWENMKTGDIRNAYEKFDLSGCGTAFLTKFLYFLGLSFGITPLPVILDRQVAKSLDFVCKQESWNLKDFVDVDKVDGKISFVKRYADGYINYVEAVNQWASRLGCRADNIEHFMYLKGSALENQQRLHNIEAWRNKMDNNFSNHELMIKLNPKTYEILTKFASVAGLSIGKYAAALIEEKLEGLKQPSQKTNLPDKKFTNSERSHNGDNQKEKMKKLIEEEYNFDVAFTDGELKEIFQKAFKKAKHNFVAADNAINKPSSYNKIDEDIEKNGIKGKKCKKDYYYLFQLQNGENKGKYKRYDLNTDGSWICIMDDKGNKHIVQLSK